MTLKLLSRIKALFEPKPAPPVTEAETQVPERIAAVESPPAAEAPIFRAEVPTLQQEAATPIREAPAAVAEAPPVPEEVAPPVVQEEAPPEVIPPPVPVAAAGGVTLRLESERGPQSTFEVTKSGATIGRGPESTIQLADLSVSRKHAKITYKQGAYWLSDLGSMGGTWLDGTKLAAPRRVATGQTIDIGLCRLTVVAAAEGEKHGAAKGPSNGV